MSANVPFTKENLDSYLKELGKVFRKLNGKKTPAEVILVGGAAVLANYGFRDLTYDIDAIILASSVMKEAINRVGDEHGLPHGWFNADFKKTDSYTNKLIEISIPYKTFSNVLSVRTISAEYLLAMKLKAGREYKNDLSDIAGILWEHEKAGTPITQEMVDKAVNQLYGGWESIPEISKKLISNAFKNKNYETLYQNSRESELSVNESRVYYKKSNAQKSNSKSVSDVLIQARKKRDLLK